MSTVKKLEKKNYVIAFTLRKFLGKKFMINFLIRLFYKKLLRYLARCNIQRYNDILNFFISNRRCRKFFYNFIDESIKILGPDTKFKITKGDAEIIATCFIDNRANDKYELFKKVMKNIKFYYCYTNQWGHAFIVDVKFLDR